MRIIWVWGLLYYIREFMVDSPNKVESFPMSWCPHVKHVIYLSWDATYQNLFTLQSCLTATLCSSVNLCWLVYKVILHFCQIMQYDTVHEAWSQANTRTLSLLSLSLISFCRHRHHHHLHLWVYFIQGDWASASIRMTFNINIFALA